MSTEQPRIESVHVGDLPKTIIVDWQDGGNDVIDLTGSIARYAALAPLDDPMVFAKVEAGLWGWSADWPDGIVIGADILNQIAELQRTWTGKDFTACQDNDLGFSNSELAELLGITTRTVEKYRSSSRDIPKRAQIACLAMRNDPVMASANYHPRKPGRPRKTA
jgi:hypothetical protein